MNQRYRSSIAVLIFLLLIPMFTIPTYAQPQQNQILPQLWFECSAGYSVFPSMIITNTQSGNIGSLGIDVYHVHSSNLGPNFNLAIFYMITIDPTNNEINIEPIKMYSSKSLTTNKLELPFIVHPELSVMRKGLKLEATHQLTREEIQSDTDYLIFDESIPNLILIDATPRSHNYFKPHKIPDKFTEITINSPKMSVYFKGTWCATIISSLTQPPIPVQYSVFNVRVTIDPNI